MLIERARRQGGMLKTTWVMGASALALLSTGVAAPALAQTAAGAEANRSVELEEVVVRSRRVEERLQDVPVAVSAFTEAKLEEQKVVRVQDLERITPSLTITPSTRGNSSPAFALRGQRAFEGSILADPAIAVYFAEVGQTRTWGANSTLFDLESVEVLKGPQGTLFGRNTTGGAILLNPRAPNQEFGGYVNLQLGNFDYRQFEGVLNVPVTDTLAVRGSLKRSKREGYMTNLVNGQHGNDVDETSARLGVVWEPTDTFKTTTYATFYDADTVGSIFKLDFFSLSGLPAPFRPVFGPLLVGDLAENQRIGKYEYRGSLDRSDTVETRAIQNTTEWEIGDNLTLRNIIGYKEISTTYQIEHTETEALNTTGGSGDVEQISEELQIVGSKGIFDFVAGVFYFKEEGTDFRITEAWKLQPGPNTFPFTINDFDAVNTSQSAYAHGNVDLAGWVEGLSLSGGARWTKDTREVNYFIRQQRGGPFGRGGPIGPFFYQCVITGAVSPVNTRSFCNNGAKTEFTEPTWDASVNYKFNDNSLLYLAVRHGYRSGGFSLSPTNVLDLKPYKPEIVDDIEVGAKTQFYLGEVPIRLNAAVYRAKGSDVQRQVQIFADNRLVNRIENAAATTTWGAELEISAKPTSRWSVDFSYSWIDPKYDEWKDLLNIGGVLTPIDISDSKFTAVPEHQVNLSTRYVLPFPEDVGEVSLFAAYYYQSEVATTEINTSNCGPNGLYSGCLNRDTSLPGYGLINLRADWKDVMGRGFDLGVFVNNAGDKFYRSWGLTVNSATGWKSSFINPPRMFGVELKVPFGSGG